MPTLSDVLAAAESQSGSRLPHEPSDGRSCGTRVATASRGATPLPIELQEALRLLLVSRDNDASSSAGTEDYDADHEAGPPQISSRCPPPSVRSSVDLGAARVISFSTIRRRDLIEHDKLTQAEKEDSPVTVMTEDGLDGSRSRRCATPAAK